MLNASDVIAAFVGSVSAEVLFWYQARSKLPDRKYQRLMKSKAYWGSTIAMVLLCVTGSVLWFYGDVVSPRGYLLAGAAFPVLIKRPGQTLRTLGLNLGQMRKMRLLSLIIGT